MIFSKSLYLVVRIKENEPSAKAYNAINARRNGIAIRL
jgi:hypothetical protein